MLFLSFECIFADTKKDAFNKKLDSAFIFEVQDLVEPDKVLHAEPLFIDLIRDLGARKGEKEWNVGLGITDNNNYDYYTFLVEYEFAVIDRLGIEVELPFSIYYPFDNGSDTPQSKLNSLKIAAQFTFLVSQEYKTSLALGYIHEFELNDFANYAREKILTGNVFNPFFVAAKRWGNNFHTLIYTGPQILQHFNSSSIHINWQINTNFHYMITGTRNFIGIELNKEFRGNDFDMVIRPQMRVGISDNLMIGIVTGIPIDRENQRFSTFLRLIYEPGH
ncbi:hypothetical protein MASR1M45_14230 [Candidatus Kapaibacterium sp.]